MYVVCIRITVCNICSTYLYTGKGRHRWSKLKSCNSYQNSGCSRYGMGNGFPNKYSKWNFRNEQEKLGFLNFIGSCNRSFMALLL